MAVFRWTLFFAGLQLAGATLEHAVPSFSLQELRQGIQDEPLKQVLTTTGLLSIRMDAPLSEALEGLCTCTSRSSIENVAGTDVAVLDDGRTRRTTVATATVGTSTPLPLPEDLASLCGLDTLNAMESLRDQVAVASDAFVQALDRLLVSQQQALLQDVFFKTYKSVEDIRQGANHLEHFHVYSKPFDKVPMSSSETASLDWHTDAGLFLAFVPARSCDDDDDKQRTDASFYLKDHQDKPKQAIFQSNTVSIMLGAGAEQWLQTQVPLKATRHAVQMESGTNRAWYGMMHLVPETAIVQSSTPKPRTFGDMKKAMTLSADRNRVFGNEPTVDDQVAIGCGLEEPAILNSFVEDSFGIPQPRRRLQAQDPSTCNNSTNFFCWMRCLDIPNHEQAEGYLNEGYSLYCLDPGVLASSGNRVSQAVEPCAAGRTHNSNCQGSWQPTAPGVEAAPVNVESNLDWLDEPFCYGGTSMFMDGFAWSSTVCVIYLFPEWILSTPGKMTAACIGTLLIGILLEKVIEQRRRTVKSMPAGRFRLLASGAFYGVQLTLGYFIMLVVMTYSGPLFMCVILGIVGGHILFNAQDALLVKNVTGGNSSEERKQEVPGEQDSDSGANRASQSCSDSAGVPEGATPCCQNTL